MTTLAFRIFSPSSRQSIHRLLTHRLRVPAQHFRCNGSKINGIKCRWQSTQPKSPTSKAVPTPTRVTRRAPQVAVHRDAVSGLQMRMEHLFRSADRVLLYRAGSRRVFNFWAFLIGGALMGGGILTGNVLSTYAQQSGLETIPWLLVGTQVITVGSLLVVGAVIFWTPFKCIKSVTAIANRGGPRMQVRPILLCEVSQPLPFMPKRTLEVATIDARMEKQLALVDASDVHSIPLAKSKSFTEEYFSPTTSGSDLAKSVSVTNRSMVDIWPMTKSAVRSMMLREGFIKMHLRGYTGVWKLDLHGCQLLDAGQALQLVTTVDADVGRGVFTQVADFLFRKVDKKRT